jgi:hypothetical protein
MIRYRIALALVLLTLAAIRFGLNPPIDLVAVWILGTWLVVAALFIGLEPRQEGSACLSVLLRLVFFLYETSAIVLLMQRLGGTGWLTILLLLYPTLELNRLYPGKAGRVGSVLATAACTVMVGAEALGWIPHDPFFTVADPLYREPLYVLAVLVVAAAALVVLPAWTAVGNSPLQGPQSAARS